MNSRPFLRVRIPLPCTHALWTIHIQRNQIHHAFDLWIIKTDTGDLCLEWVDISSESLDLFWSLQQMNLPVGRTWSEGSAGEHGIPLSFLLLSIPHSLAKFPATQPRLCAASGSAPRGPHRAVQATVRGCVFALNPLNTIWKQCSGYIVIQTAFPFWEKKTGRMVQPPSSSWATSRESLSPSLRERRCYWTSQLDFLLTCLSSAPFWVHMAGKGARGYRPSDGTDAVEGALQMEVWSLSAFKHIHGPCRDIGYKHNIHLPPPQQFGSTWPKPAFFIAKNSGVRLNSLYFIALVEVFCSSFHTPPARVF